MICTCIVLGSLSSTTASFKPHCEEGAVIVIDSPKIVSNHLDQHAGPY